MIVISISYLMARGVAGGGVAKHERAVPRNGPLARQMRLAGHRTGARCPLALHPRELFDDEVAVDVTSLDIVTAVEARVRRGGAAEVTIRRVGAAELTGIHMRFR